MTFVTWKFIAQRVVWLEKRDSQAEPGNVWICRTNSETLLSCQIQRDYQECRKVLAYKTTTQLVVPQRRFRKHNVKRSIPSLQVQAAQRPTLLLMGWARNDQWLMRREGLKREMRYYLYREIQGGILPLRKINERCLCSNRCQTKHS